MMKVETIGSAALYALALGVVESGGERWPDEDGTLRREFADVLETTDDPKVYLACARVLAERVSGGTATLDELNPSGWKARATQTVLRRMGDADGG